MKRKSLLFISIFTTLFGSLAASSPGAFAETIIDGTTYWTISELKEFDAEIDVEAKAACGEDLRCQRDYRMDMSSSQRGKYAAVDRFKNTIFLVTAVNPTTETVKLYYNDFDEMMWVFNTMERDPLDELHVFWAEDGVEDDPINVTNNVNIHVNKIKSGDPAPGIHPLVAWDKADKGTAFPANEEVEFSVAGANLADSTNNFIIFRGDHFIGITNYGDCINSETYEAGMECRLMYSEKGRKYVPVLPEIEESEPEQESEPALEEPESASEPKSELEPTAVSSTLEIANEPEIITKTVYLTKEIAVVKSEEGPEEKSEAAEEGKEEEIVDVPASGNVISCKEKTIFPWWLVVILTLADLLAVWWFLPTSLKNQRKHIKK